MKSWDNKTKEETAIERAGMKDKVLPYLESHWDGYKLIPMSTPLQIKGKIDGFCWKEEKKFIFEVKCVNGDYPAIFAEYKAVNKYGKETEGWINRESRFPNKDALLIYAMKNNLYVWDYNAIRSWFKTADKSKWRTSIIHDNKFDQDMHGYLIPVRELERFKHS